MNREIVWTTKFQIPPEIKESGTFCSALHFTGLQLLRCRVDMRI